MECKNNARRDSSCSKPSKLEDEEPSCNVRSSSYKAKGTRDDDYDIDETRSIRRTDYPSEAKPDQLNIISGTKEEKEEIDGSMNREHSRSESTAGIHEGKADSEFEESMRRPNPGGEIVIPTDPEALTVRDGFKIISMNMRDGATGKLVWESSAWGADMFEVELIEYIPKEILACRTVSREVNFQSMSMLHKFRIEQRVFFRGQCVEEWFFSFGFVIPGSTNSWQQLIEAAPEAEMMPADVLRSLFSQGWVFDKQNPPVGIFIYGYINF